MEKVKFILPCTLGTVGKINQNFKKFDSEKFVFNNYFNVFIAYKNVNFLHAV